MVKLTNDIKDTLAAAKLAWLATATKDGTPNVVVVAAVRLLDDESLLISDQYFLKTLANLEENPKVAVSWWGDKGGYIDPGHPHSTPAVPYFEDKLEWMKLKWPGSRQGGRRGEDHRCVYRCPGQDPTQGEKLLESRASFSARVYSFPEIAHITFNLLGSY